MIELILVGDKSSLIKRFFMINEDKFYKQLHDKIAKEFNTTEPVIEYIRVSMITSKKTQQEMIAHCLRKKRVSTKNKERWNDKLNFLLNANTNILNKIISVGHQVTTINKP